MKKIKYKKILGNSFRPRVSVYRSNKEIYAQIIDDISRKTLASSSSRDNDFIKIKQDNKIKTKIDFSYEVGKLLGLKAKKMNIKKLVFDKKKYLYHGRIKSLADGIRKIGLQF